MRSGMYFVPMQRSCIMYEDAEVNAAADGGGLTVLERQVMSGQARSGQVRGGI